MKQKVKIKGYILGMAMIAPTIIGLIILNIYPLLSTFQLSLTNAGTFGARDFVGLDNYISMFKNPELWVATKNTLLFVLLTVPCEIMLALVTAAFLNSKIKGKTFFRAIYFLPMVVAPAAVAMVWKLMFNSEFGIINTVLKAIGFGGVNWLTDKKFVLIACAIVTIWKAVGYYSIILLSGLQGISASYYEAARIDGANGIQRFFKITLPLVSPTMFFVLIMAIMGALQTFDVIYMMVEKGSPIVSSARTLLCLFYKESFEVGNRGYGSAIVIWTLLIIGIATAFQFWGEKKWVNYDA